MGYPVGYIISSGMVLGYGMGRRDSKPISFERYGIKLKTGYPTGRYIRGTVPRDSIFVGYPMVPVADKIIDSLERG